MQQYGKSGLALEVLSRSFIECSLKNKHIWKVFKSEVKQLSRLDIPYFYHLTDDTIIYSEDGKLQTCQKMVLSFQARKVC